MPGSLTGCGKGNTLDGTQTVAVMDETTNVPLAEVSFLLRYQQAQMESYYGAMLGMTNVYDRICPVPEPYTARQRSRA